MSIGDAWAPGSWVVDSWQVGAWLDTTTSIAAISGSAAEETIVGEVFSGVLTNETLVAAGTGPIGSIADTQALIDGLVSDKSETNGFNALRSTIAVTDVTRVSDTQWSLTIPASFSTYEVVQSEDLTWTVPGVVLVGAAPVVGTPVITITSASGEMISNDPDIIHNDSTLRHNDATLRHLDAVGLRHKRL